MTKREFFENVLKMKPSEIGTAVPFNPNGETEVTEEWLISFIKNLLAERSNWHTGTPTEEGWYLMKVKLDDEIIYDTNYLTPCVYGMDWRYAHGEIIEWQKIEENEDGRTD